MGIRKTNTAVLEEYKLETYFMYDCCHNSSFTGHFSLFWGILLSVILIATNSVL